MKRWALITVGLYLAALLGITGPVYLACFGGWRMTVADVWRVFAEWGYWIWIGVAVLAQVLLLAVPVAAAEGRPRRRRHVLVPVLTSAFLFAVICVSVITAAVSGIWGDPGSVMYEIFGNDGPHLLLVLVLYVGVMWIVWAMLFRRFAEAGEPETLIRRLVRWLLRGSILELLVAVPSHIAVRHRNDCCAPIGTFWGIATGLTVLLLAFGPGVFYLFVARMQRLKGSAAVK